ncbi:MAG: hypothetical protein N4A74_26020 [Carboxylicivirga sp.]|jgi:hypothetical protein|nr:hypothetical protein [Carboxylicivirga sp.]
MTLITRIATKKIQLVISDSLCGIRNAAQNRRCKKIITNKNLLIAKFGDFSTDVNVAFKEFEKDFKNDKDFARFKEVISHVANKARREDSTNFLITDTEGNKQILRISDGKFQEINLVDCNKLEILPDWFFSSPIYNRENGEVDHEYQDLLFKSFNRLIDEIGINDIEELKPDQIVQLATDFYSEIYFGRDLQKDFIGGMYIWLAYSIEGSSWHLDRLNPMYKPPNLEDIASILLGK